jgi:bifunctional non-homologous end joining protein LigD
MAGKESLLEVEGRQIKVSNLDKVLYPKAGFTKGQLIDYYVRIAPVLLPHLENRALTLKRYPNGVDEMYFYEKNCPKYRPPWMKTAKVWSDGNNRYMDYCIASDVATLVWLANLADIELHTSLACASNVLRPTVIAFDLDPGAPADIVQCCQVGLWIREIFEQFKLKSFAKTSGSKGLQIYVPLNTSVTFDDTKSFARAIARLLEEQHPDLVISDMKKALRVNKVFVDWSQNDNHKTTVNVYSLRAKDQPTVSTPVSWQEVEDCLKKRDPELLVFTFEQVLKRVEKSGDLFEPVLTLKQQLPALGRLAGTPAEAEAKQPPAAAKTTKKRTAKPATRKKKSVSRPARKTAGRSSKRPAKRR